ncbi:MAG: hypothetical protein M3P49_07700 [Actinomycetota bacterium]|nr:hypothetical protein [Actinomycetota bacterium]
MRPNAEFGGGGDAPLPAHEARTPELRAEAWLVLAALLTEQERAERVPRPGTQRGERAA